MLRTWLTLMLFAVICLAPVDSVCAKGGKGGGGGKGRGGPSFKAPGGKTTGRPTQHKSIAKPKDTGRTRFVDSSTAAGQKGRSTASHIDRAGSHTPGTSHGPGWQKHGRDGTTQRSGLMTDRSSSLTESGQKLTGREHSRNVQRANEERKLTHRQQTAQKLREIAERNGNENLLETADRMDQKALDHYEKRMANIDGTAPGDETTSLDQLDEALSGQNLVDDSISSLEGPLENVSLPDPPAVESLSSDISPLADGLPESIARRLSQEDRKLQHQLDVAQHLRDIAAHNGNDNLLRTAERMETMAADRYQKQLQKLGVIEDLFAPESTTPPLGGSSL